MSSYKNRNKRNQEEREEKGDNRYRSTELYHLGEIEALIRMIFWIVLGCAIVFVGVAIRIFIG